MTLPDGTEKWWEHMVAMYAALISNRLHFAQANYGDGEWGCILGERITNSQGEVYCDEIQDALRHTLLDNPTHWCGTNPGPKHKAGAEAFIEEHDITVNWLFKETLAAANVNGGLAPFLRACRTRSTVLVGPDHLRDLPKNVIGRFQFIEVPHRTAWQHYLETCDAVLSAATDGSLVLFCSGFATNLSIHKLWPHYQGRATMLDCGAIFDPYVGVLNRKGYRKESFLTVNRARNLI